MNVTVSGIGYVGLASAVLLAQHNRVTAFDLSPERVALVNRRRSPINDPEIKEFLAERALSLRAVSSREEAYAGADFIVIATPTDYDVEKNRFDTASVEAVLRDLRTLAPGAAVVIKSTVPIGFTERIRAEYPGLSIIFSPEFLREGKALYDNLYPSRIIMGGGGGGGGGKKGEGSRRPPYAGGGEKGCPRLVYAVYGGGGGQAVFKRLSGDADSLF
jgi:UDPglucose 6-dehydrogenase